MLLKAQDQTITFDLVDFGELLDDGGNPLTQDNGRFEISKDATLEMELGDTLGSDTSVLDVNGDVNFLGNNKVLVTGDIETVAGEHTLITADKITGFENDMVTGTWLTNVEVVGTGTDDTIKVVITYNEDFDGAELVSAAAENGADITEQAMLGAFAGIVENSENIEVTETSITFTGPRADFLSELTSLLTNGGAGAAAANLSGELTPDRSGAKLHAAQRVQNKQFDIISNRTNSLRADQFHAVNSSNSGLWMEVYGNDGEKDVKGRIDGYKASGMGFSFGIDGQLSDNLIGGMAFSQNNQEIDTILYDSNYDVDSYQLSAYSLWNHDQFFVTGAVNAGINYFDSYRTIGEGVPGVTDSRAAAEFSSFHYGARLTAGMDLAVSNVLMQPLIAAEFNRVEVENYEESGSVASLAYEKQTVSQAKLGAGMNLSSTFEIGNGILTPSMSAMGWYDFNADNQSISGYIVERPEIDGTITTANGSSETRFNFRAGIDYTSNGTLSLGLAVQHDIEDDANDSQIQARLNYAF